MEEKEIDRLSEELKDVEVPREFNLEEILKEDFGDTPEQADTPGPAETPGEPDAGENIGEDEPSPEEPLDLPPELLDGAAAQETPDGGLEGYTEDGPPRPKRERRRLNVPEIPAQVLFLLAGMALAAVLASIAVAARLEGAAWRVMMTLSLIVACVPMAIGSAGILSDRGRVPAPLIMIAACVLRALSAGVVEAVISAISFNLLYAVMEAFTGHELRLVYDRLEAGLDGMGESERTRVQNQLREIAGKRLKPVVLERAVDRFLLLGLLGVGVVISVLPPLIGKTGFETWIGRASALLAVGLYAGETATLMNYLNGVDSCVTQGIFFSGTAAMSACAEVTSVLFGKSGTLTDGDFRVAGMDPVRLSEDQLIFLAAYAGAWSEHPLHRAVRRCAGFTPDRARVERHREKPGYGTVVLLDGRNVIAAGNIDLMEELGVKGDLYIPGETCMFVAVGETCVGRIDFTDGIRADAANAVSELRRQGIANVALMTGDNALNATNVGKRVGITEVYSDCRPEDKLSRLQYLLDSQESDDRLAFVSADSADRELLEMANISVAMGPARGDSGTFPDIVIPSGKLLMFPGAIGISRAVRRNSRVSFLVSAGVRLLVAALTIAGVLTLWSAATIMLLLQAGLFFNTRVPDER